MRKFQLVFQDPAEDCLEREGTIGRRTRRLTIALAEERSGRPPRSDSETRTEQQTLVNKQIAGVDHGSGSGRDVKNI